MPSIQLFLIINMFLHTIMTTIVYALGLPAIIEFKRFYNEICNILIKFQQQYKLSETTKKYLWPRVEDALKLINFESIEELYNDISEGKSSDVCVGAYIKRSGTFEYIFIILISSLVFVSIVKKVILLFKICVIACRYE